jgi:negative regulator of sigma E activity
MTFSRVSGTALLCAAVVLFTFVRATAQSTGDQALLAQIDRADNHRETDLAGYTVEELYTITNSHFNTPAVALVKVTYTRDTGKHYEVISRSGPSLLASTMLNSMIAEEQKLSINPSRALAQITSANYAMTHTGSEELHNRPCEVLAVTPLRSATYVLKGRIWVDAATKELVRIDGIPPQSPSFFAGKPKIIRDYHDVAGFPLATHSHATASGFFAGSTVVDIDYTNYKITQ